MRQCLIKSTCPWKDYSNLACRISSLIMLLAIDCDDCELLTSRSGVEVSHDILRRELGTESFLSRETKYVSVYGTNDSIFLSRENGLLVFSTGSDLSLSSSKIPFWPFCRIIVFLHQNLKYSLLYRYIDIY
jgi:hypothetical protein